MTPITDVFVKYIKAHGWLSTTTITFKDGITITQHGCACLCESEELIFAASLIDSSYTENLESEFFVVPRDRIGFQQTIVAIDLNKLLHFDANLFTHAMYDQLAAENKIPEIPTPEQILAMTKDEETGLYPGTDTIETINGTLISSIPFYPANNTPITYYGARVDGWKTWYERQKNFITIVESMFGVSGCI